MTRIIAGQAGSLRLEVPAAATRPTSDRVREAIFSALEARRALEGARVLDLYAGSGALGFEALSRGGASLVAIDSNRVAFAALQTNRSTMLRALTPQPAITLINKPVQRALNTLDATSRFDLVFIDPPYDLTHAHLRLDLEVLGGFLAENALVVLERGKKSTESDWPDGYDVVAEKSYGDTRVVTLSR